MKKIFIQLSVAAVVFAISHEISAQNKLDDYSMSRHLINEILGHLRYGDTERAFTSLKNIFLSHGASIQIKGADALSLKLQDFRNPVNSYENGSTTIHLSRMPDQSNALAYWQSYSEKLTDGKFKAKGFFRDNKEMSLMANFNVLVLAAHEIGHYLDYRYSLNKRIRRGPVYITESPLNCVETTADFFAVAVIEYLSINPKFKELRTRYRSLIAEFNRSIPSKNRLSVSGYSVIEKNCGSVDLKTNGTSSLGIADKNFFQRYASAYFNRFIIMLDSNRFPTLSELVEKRLRRKIDEIQFTDDLVSVSTNENLFNKDPSVKFNEYGKFEAGIDKFRLHGKKTKRAREREIFLLDYLGEPKVFKTIGTGRELTVEISSMLGKRSERIKYTFTKEPYGNAKIVRILSVSKDRFALLLVPNSNSDRIRNDILFLMFNRGKTGWTGFTKVFEGLPNTESFYEYVNNISVTSSGEIVVVSKREKGSKHSELIVNTVNSKTLQIENTVIVGRFENRFLKRLNQKKHFVVGDNRVVRISAAALLEFSRDGLVRTIVGYFNGLVDGKDKKRILLSNVNEARPTGNGEIILADFIARKKENFFIRTLRIR